MAMKKIVFIFLSVFCANISFAQNFYYVQFKDKNGTEFSLNKPQKFLSQRAIQRRISQGIALDSTDLPVSKKYLISLKNYQANILYTSKWLNGATIFLSDTLRIEEIKNLPFVSFVQCTKRTVLPQNLPQKIVENSNNYANSAESISDHTMLGLDSLHYAGFSGKNILIAVIDAGFPNVDVMAAFNYIRPRILDTYNFVENQANVYTLNSHGTMVLSVIGAVLPDFIGAAPDASFVLYISEDAATETLLETDNWVAAAERADSIGADIITTSLGYSVFDDENDNFTYSDMDGKTTRISRASTIAARKGILLFNSAGNEGNKSWKYITAPADANSIITVGSVDSLENHSDFSSMGPTFDGRIKPTICTQGTQTALVYPDADDVIIKGNGTSFASPLAAGMAASIWSAFPYLTNFELMNKIIESANNYENPDTLCGYGIPNVWKIYNSMKGKSDFSADNKIYFAQIKYNILFIQSSQSNDYQFYFCDVLGRKIISGSGNGSSSFYLPTLSKGIYILKIFDKTIKQQTIKLIF